MTLGPKAQLYVLIVSAGGLAVLVDCIRYVLHHPIKSDWVVLAALTLFSGFFTIKVPKLQARLSVSETFVFASVLLFGTCAGTLTVALDILVASLRFNQRPKEPVRVVFNVCAAAVSIWVAGNVFYALAGIPPLSERRSSVPQFFGPLVLLAALYFVLNSVFVALALALERKFSAFTIWRNNFLWLSVNYFGGASVAALLVSYTQTIDAVVLGIIGPLLVISYLTFKTSFSRIDDATRHVEEVNRLYLSTIETLATAIDAKDQVTHGHIRRVQRFTLALAMELGLRDDNSIKALEAAALLHDTGKLIVPEHILNKPGKLTAGEFERMKLHASAGADILSAINFPYPVVPIVRHHHENWDGSGYPDGLRGTDIPIGARILAVVDCFDALTSDRPYRRKLSDVEALDILMQRRGTMYDPLVVDTFATLKERLTDTPALKEELNLTSSRRELSRRTSDAGHEPARLIDDDFSLACQTVLQSLRDATGATLAMIYLRDFNVDEAFCVGAVPLLEPGLETNAMRLGTGISGWVIANGRSIANADAALDFETRSALPSVIKCAAVPVLIEGEPVAALTCYTQSTRGFGDRDVAVMEKIAATFATEPLQTLLRGAVVRTTQPYSMRSVH